MSIAGHRVLSWFALVLLSGCTGWRETDIAPRSTVATKEDYAFYSEMFRRTLQAEPNETIVIAEEAIPIVTAATKDCMHPRDGEERAFAKRASELQNLEARWKPEFDFGRPYRIVSAQQAHAIFECFSPRNKDASCLEYKRVRVIRYLALPLFNRDHSRAVTAISRICGGLCGEGSVLTFRKQLSGFRDDDDNFASCWWIS